MNRIGDENIIIDLISYIKKLDFKIDELCKSRTKSLETLNELLDHKKEKIDSGEDVIIVNKIFL